MKSTKRPIAAVLGTALVLGLGACASTAERPEHHRSANAAKVAPAPADRYAMQAIMKGDYAKAEEKLRTTAAKRPDDPYALLNLAFVLQKTGRQAEAARLYEDILELEANPKAGLASGYGRPVKDVARTALGALDTDR